MRLYQMEPGKPQCLLYSAAILLDVPPRRLIEEIGHDGMEIRWPELKAPGCYRSHHIQEIIDCFIRRGYVLVPIEREPVQAPCSGVPICYTYEHVKARDRFEGYFTKPAIVIGKLTSTPHAWVYDGRESFYDPNGFITNKDDHRYEILESWNRIKIGKDL